MRRLTRYFFQGVLFMAPIGITIYVLARIFEFVDKSVFHIPIPGVGFAIVVLLAVPLLTLIGFCSSNLFTRGLMQLLDEQFDRFPVIKLLHSSLKDLFGAFVGNKKKFTRPVLVTVLPGSDLKFVGFVTCTTMESWGLMDHVAVYVPAAFNFGGNLIVLPKDRVQPVALPTADVMAFAFSGGVAGERQASAAPGPEQKTPAAAGKPAN